MAIKNFGKKTMHEFLSARTYYIPNYQREYAWTDDNIMDFWQDLQNARETARSHFYGQIVVHEDEDDKKAYIIDGQQRTTTSVIFLSVLRDCFKAYEKENNFAQRRVNEITIKYIGEETPREQNLMLSLGLTDRGYFRDNIQMGSPKNKGQTPSQERIYKAYYMLLNYVKNEIDKYDELTERIETLYDIYKSFLDNFLVMVVTTDDINEAFVIFETLNARGKDLETADLLKNNIFMKAKKNIEEVKNYWLNMLDTLISKDDTTKYIRYYWNSSHRFMREKDLYREINNYVNKSNCVSFMAELNRYSELYNALVAPKDCKYFDDEEITDLLYNISLIGITLFYPVIFCFGQDGI